MNFIFYHDPVKKPEVEPAKHPPSLLKEPADYTNEGSEFLDDAIRTKDQPLVYTEEAVAPGSPENLL
jgi:hypothetical protein